MDYDIRYGKEIGMRKVEGIIFSIVSRMAILGMMAMTIMVLNSPNVYGQAKDKALLNLNTASQQELEAIKGVGPATAKKIIAGRPYKSVAELSKAGISDKMIESIKPLVTVGPAAQAAKLSGEAEKAKPTAEKAKTTGEKAKTAAKLAPGQKININSATKEQLDALPEIGSVKAQAIIDGRPYQKIEDIMKVKGIKEGIFSKIKDYITVK
jgi:competence protein ComEA